MNKVLLALVLAGFSLPCLAQDMEKIRQKVRDIQGTLAGGSETTGNRNLAAMNWDEIRQVRPYSPNPYVSYLPMGMKPDYEYWDRYMLLKMQEQMKQSSQNQTDQNQQARVDLIVDPVLATLQESEPNNLINQANTIPANAINPLVTAALLGSGAPDDTDVFAVDLTAGDVLSAMVNRLPLPANPIDNALATGLIRVTLLDSNQRLLISSNRAQAFSAIANDSPLFFLGNAGVNYVIPTSGRYFLRLEFAQILNYELRTGAFRPALEHDPSVN